MRTTPALVHWLLLAISGCVALPGTDLDGGVDGGQSTLATAAAGSAVTGTASAGTGSTGSAVSGIGGGALADPDASAIETTTCTQSFFPCGGDPTGTWDVVGVCVQGDLAAAANAEYATDSSACSSACTAASLSAHGSVTYDAGYYVPNVLLSLTETLQITPGCYAALTGNAWSSTACSSMTQSLESLGNTSATCIPANSGCACVYSTNSLAAADSYTVNGTTLVASDGSTTDFCVQGITMTERDSLGSGVQVITQFSKH